MDNVMDNAERLCIMQKIFINFYLEKYFYPILKSAWKIAHYIDFI